MDPFKQLALLAVLATAVYAVPNGRGDKSIGIFNVVKFPNAVCDTGATNNMNGTCYTAEECTGRNGVATGACADGYGVCCVITLSCGGTTSENCTYLVQAASNTPSVNPADSPNCVYTICPADGDINRIRLDLTMFQIAPPVPPVDVTGAAAGTFTTGRSIGTCNMDTFTITGTAGPYPVICGVNNGQHMIVDTDGEMCVTASFSFGGDNTMRNYNIHVTQYAQLNEMGGPPGCLQYYTGQMGTVNTFNWQAIGTSVHLVNQNYNVCVRRMANRCVICWAPITSGNVAGAQPVGVAAAIVIAISGTFGLSNGGSANGVAMAKSGSGALCPTGGVAAAIDSADYVIIPNGVAGTIALANPGGVINNAVLVDTFAAGALGQERFCGRFFAANTMLGVGQVFDATVCSRITPFSLTVVTDNAEAVGALVGGAAASMQAMNEASTSPVNVPVGSELEPLGTMGFSLGFNQHGC